MIDAEHRELQLLGHAPDEAHIPVPAEHRPPAFAFQQAEGDVSVVEVDNPGSAWILAESGTVEVKQ